MRQNGSRVRERVLGLSAVVVLATLCSPKRLFKSRYRVLDTRMCRTADVSRGRTEPQHKQGDRSSIAVYKCLGSPGPNSTKGGHVVKVSVEVRSEMARFEVAAWAHRVSRVL